MRGIQVQINIFVPDGAVENLTHALAYLVNTTDPVTANLLQEGCIELDDRDYLELARPEVWGEIIQEGITAIGHRLADQFKGDLEISPEDALGMYYQGLSDNTLLEVLKFRIAEGLPLFVAKEEDEQ